MTIDRICAAFLALSLTGLPSSAAPQSATSTSGNTEQAPEGEQITVTGSRLPQASEQGPERRELAVRKHDVRRDEIREHEAVPVESVRAKKLGRRPRLVLKTP